jgi:hypothetical protein
MIEFHMRLPYLRTVYLCKTMRIKENVAFRGRDKWLTTSVLPLFAGFLFTSTTILFSGLPSKTEILP